MKTNSDTTTKLYIGLDVHKEQTVIAILEGERNAEPRQYGSVATALHALERAVRRRAANSSTSTISMWPPKWATWLVVSV